MFTKNHIITAAFAALFAIQGCSDADAKEIAPAFEATDVSSETVSLEEYTLEGEETPPSEEPEEPEEEPAEEPEEEPAEEPEEEPAEEPAPEQG